MSTVKLSLFHAGYCTSPEHIAIQGGGPGHVRFPAMFALIEHPRRGPMLFDTGYSFRFFEATRRYPARLYAQITPVTLREDEAAVYQLAARGIRPEDIEQVLISHFHADHVAAIADFPRARYAYLPHAFEAVSRMRGLQALANAYLPALIPRDFIERSNPLSPGRLVSLPPEFAPFTRGVDLFGDESVIAVELPGHAVGQMGLFVREESGEAAFLVADAAWLARSFEENRPPHRLANLLFSDPAAYRETLAQLHDFHHSRPEVHVIPSHCEETLRRYAG